MNKNTKDDFVCVKGVTPAGIAIWPKLLEPDTKFDEAGVFSLKLKLTEEEAAPLIEKIEKVAKDAYEEAVADATPKNRAKLQMARPSYEPEYDEDGNATDNVIFGFKMKASGINRKTGKAWTRKPALFDSKGMPITQPPYEIWSGSVVRVAFELIPYNSPMFGIGCAQRFSAVQIIKLVEGTGKSADDYGFDVEEEGFSVSEYGDISPTTVGTSPSGIMSEDAEGDY